MATKRGNGKGGLKAKQVEHIKAGDSRIEVAAGSPAGLYLVVQPSGRKTWALRYRWRGRTRKLTFEDPYPEMSLAAARAEANLKLEALERDEDPAGAYRQEVLAEKPDSAKKVAAEYVKRYAEPNTKSWKETERILDKNVLPAWPDKFVTEITRTDILRLLDSIVDSDRPILANRVLAIVRGWMRWCVERGILDTSPAAGIRPPTSEKSRDRVLTPSELAEIWSATLDLGTPFGDYFRFLLLTAQRRTEVATMEWPHVDLDKALWTLPAEKTKAARVHDVPISKPALKLLDGLPRFESADPKQKADHVFTTTSGVRPISGYSGAKEKLDGAILERRKKAGNEEPVFDWRIHDFRRTAATYMAGQGVPPQVVAAILNHTPGSTQGVTSIYNRFRYTEERRAALDAWGQFVTSLVGGKKAKASPRRKVKRTA